MNRNRLRKFINDVHLWLGLSSGLILFIVCLTGTVYTFRAEIERWLEPEKYYFEADRRMAILPADTIVARVAHAKQGTVTGIVVPGDVTMNWQVSVKNNKPVKAEASATSTKEKAAPLRPKTYFVNPTTGEIVGEQGGSTSEFFSTVMKLHRWLLMEDYGGRIIVGTATMIFVFMIISGLVLWFPARLKNIRQGLKIKTSANWKRINHDLHNTLGFYSFVLLLIMALTGLCWSFEWYRDGLSGALGTKVFKGRNEKPLVSADTTGTVQAKDLASLVNSAQKLFHYDGNLRLSLPENPFDAITVTKSATGFFSVAGADKAQLDRFSGEPLKVETFSSKPLNEKVADSIKIIHTGEILGTFSKIIYFIVCLIATSLPVTGTFIWLNKMKKKKIKTNKLPLYRQTQYV